MRLECLRLVDAKSLSPSEAVEAARLFADFVLGTKDAEIVRDAKEFAKRVAA